jgi:hypothetical protein
MSMTRVSSFIRAGIPKTPYSVSVTTPLLIYLSVNEEKIYKKHQKLKTFFDVGFYYPRVKTRGILKRPCFLRFSGLFRLIVAVAKTDRFPPSVKSENPA